jgi:hypothetical protein
MVPQGGVLMPGGGLPGVDGSTLGPSGLTPMQAWMLSRMRGRSSGSSSNRNGPQTSPLILQQAMMQQQMIQQQAAAEQAAQEQKEAKRAQRAANAQKRKAQAEAKKAEAAEKKAKADK